MFFTLFFHVVQRKYFNGGCLTAIVDLKVNFIFEKSTEKIYAFFQNWKKLLIEINKHSVNYCQYRHQIINKLLQIFVI